MSLINQMLSDLDSRQAFVNEKSDSVLNGLQHTDTYEYEEDNSRPLLLYMLLSILLISLLVYAVSTLSSLGNLGFDNAGKVLSALGIPAADHNNVSDSSPDNQDETPDNAENLDMSSGIIISGTDETQVSDNNPVVEPEYTNTLPTDRSTTEYVDKQTVSQPLPMLILAKDISLPERNDILEMPVTDSGEEIQSLTLSSSENGLNIDLEFSLVPDYSVFTLQDPARLVIELVNIGPVDTARFQDRLPESVSLRSRREESGSLQLIFEFPEPVSLQDTVLARLDHAPSLHIVLSHGMAPVNLESVSTGISVESEIILPSSPPETVERPQLEKKVHKEDMVRQSNDRHQDAMLAWRNGDVITAMDGLYSAVASNANNHKARVTLVELLLEQGDEQAARKLLVDGLSLKPDHSRMAKLLARLLAEEQNNRLALYYLQRAMPDVRTDTEFHALVAALLQREKRHQEAIAFYRNVLGVNSSNGLWWMGLGISLEATGASRRALSAYLRARRDSSISAGVAKYLDTRISQLNKMQTS